MIAGRHNANLDASIKRLQKGRTYKDLSTLIVCPARVIERDGQRVPEGIPPMVTSAWMNLMRPMNQICIGPVYFEGYEVGDAYNAAVEAALSINPPIRYMLTVETDNLPPPDGLLKLLEDMERWDAVGGLYWTKGEAGQPMIYGDPNVMPKNFFPQVPQAGEIQKCNGLGMGFTLFSVDLFRKMADSRPKDANGRRVFFKTVQEYTPGVGARAGTQDLYFFDQAAAFGARIASDNRVLVGHLDADGKYGPPGTVW